MSEWYTVVEMSERTQIPQQTLRRYINRHKHFMNMKKEHKVYKLHEECEAIINQMREFYESGKNAEEVDDLLASGGVPVIHEVESDVSDQSDIKRELRTIKEELEGQKQFNEELLSFLKADGERRWQEQQKWEATLKQRDEKIMELLTESQETQQLLIEQQKVSENQVSEQEEETDVSEIQASEREQKKTSFTSRLLHLFGK